MNINRLPNMIQLTGGDGGGRGRLNQTLKNQSDQVCINKSLNKTPTKNVGKNNSNNIDLRG